MNDQRSYPRKKKVRYLCAREKFLPSVKTLKKNVRESPKKDLKSVSRTLLIFT